MAYKEKTCPKCGTKHTKRGEFCSRSCGNSRAHTPEHKAKTSDGLRQWHRESDTAAVAAHNFTSKGLHKEEEPVAPLHHSPLRVNQFIDADGDLWTEN